MDSLLLGIFFIIGILFAFFSLEIKNRLYSVILLLISTLSLGIILLYIQAYLIGLFYILIYSGLLSVLFASVSNFLEKEPTEILVKTPTIDQTERME